LIYNKKRHLELLDQQGDKFDLKLHRYSVILIDHLNWEVKAQYFELLKNYTEKKIDCFNFRTRFCERYESIEKVAELLESNRVLLSPNKNCVNFGDLLGEIELCCRMYSGDPEPFRNELEIGPIEFRTSMEKIYLEIQIFLNSPPSKNMLILRLEFG